MQYLAKLSSKRTYNVEFHEDCFASSIGKSCFCNLILSSIIFYSDVISGENINNNSARLAVGVWLFLVFVLTSSYTANLSSLLTVKRLKSGRDIEWLKQNNLPVGCDDSSTFVKDFMVEVYDFNPKQVIAVDIEYDIVDKFNRKIISALFLESPYEKVFLNKYFNVYTAITAAYKFGGMGFVSAYNSFKNFTYVFCILKMNF